MIFATFLEDMAIGTLAVLALMGVMWCAREILWFVDWVSDQVKRRWRDR